MGGNILDGHPVTGIIPGDVVTVKSSKGNIKAKKILITVGMCYITKYINKVLIYSM